MEQRRGLAANLRACGAGTIQQAAGKMRLTCHAHGARDGKLRTLCKTATAKACAADGVVEVRIPWAWRMEGECAFRQRQFRNDGAPRGICIARSGETA